MRKTAHATVLMLALLSSVLAGACFVNWVEANPEPARSESYGIHVLSPQNTTYYTDTVSVQVKVIHYWYGFDGFRISVDGGPWNYQYDYVDNSTEYHYEWVVTYCKPIPLQLTEGSHTVAVKVSSGALTFCANVTFTVNVVSPYLSVLPSENVEASSSEVPLDLKYNFTEIPVGYFYESSEVPLKFVAPEASDFSYSLDGEDRVSFVGNVTLRGVSDGVHSVVLYGKTVDGSDFASEPFSVWVDTGKPQITFLSLQNDTAYRTWNVDLAFRLSEPSPEIKYTLYGNNQIQTSVIDGNTSFFNLPSGSYTLILSAKDSVSNFISFQRVNFRVDNPLPMLFVVAASVIIIVVGLLVYFKKRKH
jgi:hypothetical protein